MCGEHFALYRLPKRSAGSSPRVRGTPLVDHVERLQEGIIPACAGNTTCASWREYWPRDHPRVCGEHLVDYRARRAETGSSPRVRGTRVGRDRQERSAGIIPACAGNTQSGGNPTGLSWDHPRVCGEHRKRGVTKSTGSGSSPRVRGTRGRPHGFQIRFGIIPACAGNTPPRHTPPHTTWDHPRVCGEHARNAWNGVVSWGSSPRVRGTRGVMVLTLGTEGIIPACAGNTRR